MLYRILLRNIAVGFLENIKGRNSNYLPLGLVNQFQRDTDATLGL